MRKSPKVKNVLKAAVERGTLEQPSDRSFGLVFTCVFLLIGVIKIIHKAHITDSYPRFILAASLIVISVVKPQILSSLNYLWFKFGLLLHRIMSPLIMVFLFYGIITPTAVMLKLFKKDLLSLKFDPLTPSYWINRNPKESSTLKNQF